MSTKFGLLIRLWPSEGKDVNKYETESSIERPRPPYTIWRPISAVADPEWHDNNGDEVKIATEKSDGLKARNFSLVVRACKSRMLFLCKRLRFRRSWTVIY